MAKFKDLYNTYANQVYRFMLSLSGDPYTAEDLTQETFYKAFLHIDRFDGKSSLYTWLCQIGKNAYINKCKKDKFINYDADLTAMEQKEDFIDDLITKEQVSAIHKVLDTLPEPYKEVFTLKIFAELKYKEIADQFGKSESWAKVTFYRAKEKIIQKMEGL